jgi:hypothetical protein
VIGSLPCGQTEGRTDRHEEGNCCFSQLSAEVPTKKQPPLWSPYTLFHKRRMCSGFLQWPKVISSESNSVSIPYWCICKYWHPCARVIPERIQYQTFKQPLQDHNFAAHLLIGSTWMTLRGEILINVASKAAEIQRLMIKAAFCWDMKPWILINS